MSDLDLPDARTDLAGAVNFLIAEVSQLRREHDEIRVSATKAAEALGYNEGYFRGRPWRWPTYGLKGRKFSITDWREWNESVPEVKRRAEWDAMPISARRNARGLL